MLQNALLRITRSSHSLSTTYLRLLHSGIYGWTLQALWTFWTLWTKSSCSYQKHCYRQKPPDCLHLMILEADLHNLFDENCDVWSSILRWLLWLIKVITYKFLPGVLHRTHDRSSVLILLTKILYTLSYSELNLLSFTVLRLSSF